MDFNEATDRATATCITLAQVAEACEVSHNTVRRARMARESGSHRPPPEGWESALAKLARARAAELVELAEELEGE